MNNRFAPVRLTALPPSAAAGLPLERLREVQDVLTANPWLLALPELAAFRACLTGLATAVESGETERDLRQIRTEARRALCEEARRRQRPPRAACG